MTFGSILNRGARQSMMMGLRNTAMGRSSPMADSISDWLKAWKNGYDTLTGQPTDDQKVAAQMGQRIQQLMQSGSTPQRAMVQALTENPQLLLNTVFSDPGALTAMLKPPTNAMHVVGNNLVDNNGNVVYKGAAQLPAEMKMGLLMTGGNADDPQPGDMDRARSWVNAQHPPGGKPSSLMQMMSLWEHYNPGADPKDFINSMVNSRTGGATDNYDPTQPLPPAQEKLVDLWGHYGAAIPNGYAVSRSPAVMNMMARLYTKYPQYKQEQFNAYNKGYQYMTSGAGGNTLRYLTAGLQHLNTIFNLSQQLHNGNVDALNGAAQAIAAQEGKPAPTNMDAGAQIVGNEVLKAISGMGGAVAEGSKEKIQQAFSKAHSLPQLAGAIDTTKQLLAGQMHAEGVQFKQATGIDFRNSGWLNTPEMQQLYNEAEQRANAAPPNLKAAEQAGQSGGSQTPPNTSGGAQSGSQGDNSQAQAGPPPGAIKALQQGFVVNPDGTRTNVTPQQFDSYYGDGAAEAILNPSPANPAASPTPPDDDNGGQQQPAATAGQ